MEMSLVWRGGNCLDFWDRCLFLEEEESFKPSHQCTTPTASLSTRLCLILLNLSRVSLPPLPSLSRRSPSPLSLAVAARSRRWAPAADGCLAEAVSTQEGRQWGGGRRETAGSRGRRLPGRGVSGGCILSSARSASGEAAGSRLAEAAVAHLDGGSGRTLPVQRRRLLLELILIQEAVMKGSRDGLGGGTTMECGW
uniref:Uncharacterized protein n=1 Tax=Oryza meridionalis TaxID=40149 RepID=A0A0E0DN00_9ORYZ